MVDPTGASVLLRRHTPVRNLNAQYIIMTRETTLGFDSGLGQVAVLWASLLDYTRGLKLVVLRLSVAHRCVFFGAWILVCLLCNHISESLPWACPLPATAPVILGH